MANKLANQLANQVVPRLDGPSHPGAVRGRALLLCCCALFAAPFLALGGCGTSTPGSDDAAGLDLSVSDLAPVLDLSMPDITREDITMAPPAHLSLTGPATLPMGSCAAVYTARLAMDGFGPSSVDWLAADGSGKAGTDYAAAMGNLTFVPKDPPKTFSVPILFVPGAVAAHTFSASLVNPKFAVIDTPMVMTTIAALADFTEVWDSGICANRWQGPEASRNIGTGGNVNKLVLTVKRGDANFTQSLPLALGPQSFGGVTSLGADLTITALTTTGKADGRIRVGGNFYHSAQAGEVAGDNTGDVIAYVSVRGGDVIAGAGKCLSTACIGADYQDLTGSTVPPSNFPGKLITKLALGTTATVSVAWDAQKHLFTFSATPKGDVTTSVTVDPVAMGAAVANALPNQLYKGLGALVREGPGEHTDMTGTVAAFTVNGASYDTFSGTYLDPAKWSQPAFTRSIQPSGQANGSGAMVITTGAAYTTQAQNDFGIGNATTIGLGFGKESISSDITMVASTVVDTHSHAMNPTRSRINLGLLYQPPNQVGQTQQLFMYIYLYESLANDGTPVFGGSFNANLCLDAACSRSTFLPGPAFKQTFAIGAVLHASLSALGGQQFRATLNNENIDRDLSAQPSSQAANIRAGQLVAGGAGIVAAGESVSVTAKFENVHMGN